MDDKVHVTVTGPQKSGKTTIARIIADALNRAGFKATNIDGDAGDRAKGLFPIEADRVRRFAEGRKVTVLVANTRRSTTTVKP